MFELKLKSYRKKLTLNQDYRNFFHKPIIFYLINKHDVRPFFVTFAILDFKNQEILYLFSYDSENINIVNSQKENEKFIVEKTPHMTLSIHDGVDFLTFLDEEQYIFYVNYKDLTMKVYTGDDLVQDKSVQMKRISSTVYKDAEDPNYFYLTITDSSNCVHIYRASLTLDEFNEIDKFQGYEVPPHVIRDCKDNLLLSHVFKYPTFLLGDSGKVLDQDTLAGMILRNAIKIVMKSQSGSKPNYDLKYISLTKEQKVEIIKLLKDKYKVKILPGEILLLNKQTKEKQTYETSGGTPAHFEIDPVTNTIYTSSHNFIIVQGAFIYYEPAVIDKFKLIDNHLELVGSFQYQDGYRYTSHRVFYYKEKSYICTFAQPNRLMIIDASNMELVFYEDIDDNSLSEAEDPFLYVNTENSSNEIVTIETSANGEYILFISLQYIYIYDFEKRKICERFSYHSVFSGNMDLSDYQLRTLHINYIE